MTVQERLNLLYQQYLEKQKALSKDELVQQYELLHSFCLKLIIHEEYREAIKIYSAFIHRLKEFESKSQILLQLKYLYVNNIAHLFILQDDHDKAEELLSYVINGAEKLRVKPHDSLKFNLALAFLLQRKSQEARAILSGLMQVFDDDWKLYWLQLLIAFCDMLDQKENAQQNAQLMIKRLEECLSMLDSRVLRAKQYYALMNIGAIG